MPRAIEINLSVAPADGFSDPFGGPCVHQSPIWPVVNPPEGKQKYLYFAAHRNGDLVSSGLIRLRALLLGFQLAGIQRGPLVRNISDLPDVLTALETALKPQKVVTLNVNPYWLGDDAGQAQTTLETCGYKRVPSTLQNFPTTTALIQTSASEDDIMAAMTQTGRRQLRKAFKAGVTVRPMKDVSEVDIANAIMAQMAIETGLVLDSQHDFGSHYAYLTQNPDAGSVLVTEVDGKIFGAAVNYLEGSMGYNMILTTSSDVDVPRAYALMWHSILSMKALGATCFDMVGYPDEDVDANAGAKARGNFKRGFGPEIVKMTPIMSKALIPALHNGISWARSVRRSRKKAAVGGSE